MRTTAATVPPRRGRSRSGRGVMTVLVILLAGSGVLRLVTGPGPVLAEGVADLARDHEQSAEEPGSVRDVGAVLAALDARASRLDAQEAALQDRKAALALTEQVVRQRLTALEAAEKRLEDLIALSDGAAEGDLARLTAVYESMKPKEAAALFEAMSPDFAAGFIGRMRPERAAEILSGLTPETAYTVSVLLAGRNANAPTD